MTQEESVKPCFSVISDMDGVIYRGKHLIQGAKDFFSTLKAKSIPFIFLTNNSEQTPLDLLRKMDYMGLSGLTEQNFLTAAMATATFLKSQSPGAHVFCVGGPALSNELYNEGFSIGETNVEYVVVGKTSAFNFDMLKKAVNLINGGARFIATNPDTVDPVENGLEPACGTLLAAISAATGKIPYVIGKPNPLMTLIAKRKIKASAENTLFIGDRMDTDIISGIQAGMKTALVLSGVSQEKTLEAFPYKPTYIFSDIGAINIEKILAETV